MPRVHVFCGDGIIMESIFSNAGSVGIHYPVVWLLSLSLWRRWIRGVVCGFFLCRLKPAGFYGPFFSTYLPTYLFTCLFT